jgi:hypothetical protein
MLNLFVGTTGSFERDQNILTHEESFAGVFFMQVIQTDRSFAAVPAEA